MSSVAVNHTVTGGLEVMFNPRSVAFIGASKRPNTPASRGLRNCLRLGFAGGLYPINPNYEELFGVKCYAGIKELPEIPELVMLGISAEHSLEAIKECYEFGVRNIVVCSAGWEEQGQEGQERAKQLQAFLADKDLRILGPNCLGLGNPAIGLSLGYNSSFESLSHPRKGKVGLVTQSGAMMGGLLLNGEDVGADVAMYAHIGNGMDIQMEEISAYLLDSPDIKAIALMIEGLHDPEGFIKVARKAQQLNKPLVVFKAGRSEQGQEAVLSHTGALAGSDEVFTAVCEENNIIRVEESEDLLPVATALANWSSKQPITDEGALAVFTLSGGAASIIADECEAAGVPLAEFTAQTIEQLSPQLPSYIKISNPFDIGGAVFSDPDLPRDSMARVMQDRNVNALLWVGVGAPRDERSNLWLAQALEVMGNSDKAGVILSVSGYPQEEGFKKAHELGIPVARSIRSAIQMFGSARKWHAKKDSSTALAKIDFPALPPTAQVIDEVQGKNILNSLDINTPKRIVVNSEQEIAEHITTLAFPVVLKAVAEGVTHKSDLGLVALNLDSVAGLEAAVHTMREKNPELELNQFLIEEMAPKGVEVVIGVSKDKTFGPVLMFGLGGVFVELFKDVAFATCPVSPARARAIIAKTKAQEWLKGFRGEPAYDMEALVEAIVRISQFAAHHADRLVEMDVNPVRVLPKGEGVVALDAVLVVE